MRRADFFLSKANTSGSHKNARKSNVIWIKYPIEKLDPGQHYHIWYMYIHVHTMPWNAPGKGQLVLHPEDAFQKKNTKKMNNFCQKRRTVIRNHKYKIHRQRLCYAVHLPQTAVNAGGPWRLDSTPVTSRHHFSAQIAKKMNCLGWKLDPNSWIRVCMVNAIFICHVCPVIYIYLTFCHPRCCTPPMKIQNNCFCLHEIAVTCQQQYWSWELPSTRELSKSRVVEFPPLLWCTSFLHYDV